jgi:hypothetical protein
VTFASTFLGAFLALALTYFYDKHKSRVAEQEERLKVLNTVRHELTRNLERIDEYFQSEKDAIYGGLEADLNQSAKSERGHFVLIPDIRLERSALDTAIFSGRLFLLSEEILESLSENYRRVDVVNRNSDDLRAIARAPVNEEFKPMIANLAGVTRGTMQNLQESLKKATVALQRASEVGAPST